MAVGHYNSTLLKRLETCVSDRTEGSRGRSSICEKARKDAKRRFWPHERRILVSAIPHIIDQISTNVLCRELEVTTSYRSEPSSVSAKGSCLLSPVHS